MIHSLFQEQDRLRRVFLSKTIDNRTGRLADRSGDTVEALKHDQACRGLCRRCAQDETYPGQLHSLEKGVHSSLLSSLGDLKLPSLYSTRLVVSIQVMHHAVNETIRRIVREIERVTKPEALVFVTVPRSRNQASRFEEIEPGTLVPLDGPEKGLPHHFFTAEELARLFSRFSQLDLHVDCADHLCFNRTKRCV